jgi:hypothetical protein
MKAVNREAEIASLLISGFGVAFFGWALVHLASSPSHPNKDDRRHREPIPKVVGRHAASVTESRE